MRKVLIVFGTRPEVIKLLPIVWEFQKYNVEYKILNTNQHTKLLDSLLEEHNIIPDYQLNIKENFSDLLQKKTEMLRQMQDILYKEEFSTILVQGDTLSTLVGAEYGFLNNIFVCHVEAGMRTYKIDNH